ncbi:hypothetical protein HDV02_004412 [Globomyces sp. JEL0801]|nr:hypothetical protein HDV02_004412 [Globomyces sp. JEL0801]
MDRLATIIVHEYKNDSVVASQPASPTAKIAARVRRMSVGFSKKADLPEKQVSLIEKEAKDSDSIKSTDPMLTSTPKISKGRMSLTRTLSRKEPSSSADLSTSQVIQLISSISNAAYSLLSLYPSYPSSLTTEMHSDVPKVYFVPVGEFRLFCRKFLSLAPSFDIEQHDTKTKYQWSLVLNLLERYVGTGNQETPIKEEIRDISETFDRILANNPRYYLNGKEKDKATVEVNRVQLMGFLDSLAAKNVTYKTQLREFRMEEQERTIDIIFDSSRRKLNDQCVVVNPNREQDMRAKAFDELFDLQTKSRMKSQDAEFSSVSKGNQQKSPKQSQPTNKPIDVVDIPKHIEREPLISSEVEKSKDSKEKDFEEMEKILSSVAPKYESQTAKKGSYSDINMEMYRDLTKMMRVASQKYVGQTASHSRRQSIDASTSASQIPMPRNRRQSVDIGVVANVGHSIKPTFMGTKSNADIKSDQQITDANGSSKDLVDINHQILLSTTNPSNKDLRSLQKPPSIKSMQSSNSIEATPAIL